VQQQFEVFTKYDNAKLASTMVCARKAFAQRVALQRRSGSSGESLASFWLLPLIEV
jgi:hypothetical protein